MSNSSQFRTATINNIRTGTPERDGIRSSQTFNRGPIQSSVVYSGPIRGQTTSTTYLNPVTLGDGTLRTSTYNGGSIQNRVEYTTTTNLAPRLSTSSRNIRGSTLIGVKEGQSRFIEERYVGERITNVTHRHLEERIVSTAKPELKSYVQEIETYEDEPEIRERIVEKEVEVLVEKRVPVHKYVDVPYDVIVERPIEKIIEKEIEIEKIMEREIQKLVEIPIERIVEIPYERIVEKPVEYEVRVERPYERIVEKKVEDIYENLVYHDNYMEVDSRDLHKYVFCYTLLTDKDIHVLRDSPLRSESTSRTRLSRDQSIMTTS